MPLFLHDIFVDDALFEIARCKSFEHGITNSEVKTKTFEIIIKEQVLDICGHSKVINDILYFNNDLDWSRVVSCRKVGRLSEGGGDTIDAYLKEEKIDLPLLLVLWGLVRKSLEDPESRSLLWKVAY